MCGCQDIFPAHIEVFRRLEVHIFSWNYPDTFILEFAILAYKLYSDMTLFLHFRLTCSRNSYLQAWSAVPRPPRAPRSAMGPLLAATCTLTAVVFWLVRRKAGDALRSTGQEQKRFQVRARDPSFFAARFFFSLPPKVWVTGIAVT